MTVLPKCLRCDSVVLAQDGSSLGIAFYECPVCGRPYARKVGKGLTYRWLHPISLVLYGVLAESDPLPQASEIARNFMASSSSAELRFMAREIEHELDHPTQLVRDILDNEASEEDCRQFLAAVVRVWTMTAETGPARNAE